MKNIIISISVCLIVFLVFSFVYGSFTLLLENFGIGDTEHEKGFLGVLLIGAYIFILIKTWFITMNFLKAKGRKN